MRIRFGQLAAGLSLTALVFPACSDQGPAVPEDFSFYLTAPGYDVQDMLNGTLELTELELEASPIVTLDDIRRYDWDQHELRVSDRVGEQDYGQPFVLTVMGERVYAGVFWDPASSLSLGLITMTQVDDADVGSLIWISCHGCADSDDMRSDSRVRRIMETAGKLN